MKRRLLWPPPLTTPPEKEPSELHPSLSLKLAKGKRYSTALGNSRNRNQVRVQPYPSCMPLGHFFPLAPLLLDQMTETSLQQCFPKLKGASGKGVLWSNRWGFAPYHIIYSLLSDLHNVWEVTQQGNLFNFVSPWVSLNQGWQILCERGQTVNILGLTDHPDCYNYSTLLLPWKAAIDKILKKKKWLLSNKTLFKIQLVGQFASLCPRPWTTLAPVFFSRQDLLKGQITQQVRG